MCARRLVRDEIREYAASHPDESMYAISRAVGCSPASVTNALVGYESDAQIAHRKDLVHARSSERFTKDMAGKRYGKVTVIDRPGGRGKLWRCQCDCGRTFTAMGKNLRLGHVKSCGRCNEDVVYPGAAFGALTIVRRIGDGNGGGRESKLWECECECGEHVTCYESELVRGERTSCGCGAELLRRQAETAGRVDGTKLSSMTARLSTANKTGVKGVWYDQRHDEYHATIKLRYRKYHLGAYKTLERAADARRAAEEAIFDPILEQYGRKPTNEDEFLDLLDRAVMRLREKERQEDKDAEKSAPPGGEARVVCEGSLGFSLRLTQRDCPMSEGPRDARPEARGVSYICNYISFGRDYINRT